MQYRGKIYNEEGGIIMVSKINGQDDSIQALMMQMMQNMKSADTDGSKGLSLDELSSIDAGNDVGGSEFLKSLTEQFNALDANEDGQLTTNEIVQARQLEQMGPPPGMDLGKHTLSEDLSEFGESLGNAASSLLEKLVSTYKNGGLSELASSLNLSI